MFSHETNLLFMYKVFIVLFEKENQVKSSGAWLEGEFNDDGPKQKVHSVRSAVEINLQPTVLMKTTCRQGNRWRFLPSDTHFSCSSFCHCKVFGRVDWVLLAGLCVLVCSTIAVARPELVHLSERWL